LALVFSPRFDSTVRQVLLGVVLTIGTAVSLFYYYALPSYTRVGYQPEQPVPFSHQIHVGQLGMNCLYCHNHVAESPNSNVPSTNTCMNCHSLVKTTSPLLSKVRESWADGNPVPWKRVHKVPDYAYFNHSIHVNRGVSCVSCHGQVNEMPVVYHAKELSMGWCLNCHRQPEDHLRPVGQVTNLTWKPEDSKNDPLLADLMKDPGKPLTQKEVGLKVKEALNVNPPQTCQGCHR
jgi:hypothetical protein